MTELHRTRQPWPWTVSSRCISEHSGAGRGRVGGLGKTIRALGSVCRPRGHGRAGTRGARGRLRPRGRWGGRVSGGVRGEPLPHVPALASEGGQTLALGLRSRSLGCPGPTHCDQMPARAALCSDIPFDEVTNLSGSPTQGYWLQDYSWGLPECRS